MLSPFPFLRLPILVQLLILKNASLLDLIYFSTISQRSKQIAKSLNLIFSKIDFLLDNTSNRHSICLETDNNQELEILIPISRSLPYQSEDLLFNGYLLSVAQYQSPNWTFLALNCEDLENMELIDVITTHLLELFEVNQFLITMEGFSQISNCFLWNHTKKLKKLIFPGYSDAELSCADMKFIMEELIITDSLIINQPIDEAYQYGGSLKMKELEVKYAHWLGIEAILNMDCENLDLRKTMLTCEDLNRIVKKWMNGGMEKLESVEIKVPATGASESVILAQILCGIDHFLDNNRTFIRRNDGTKAYVEVRVHPNRFDKFSFEVVTTQ